MLPITKFTASNSKTISNLTGNILCCYQNTEFQITDSEYCWLCILMKCCLESFRANKMSCLWITLRFHLFPLQPLATQGDLSGKDCVMASYDYDEKTAREISVKEGQLLTLLNSNNRVNYSYLFTWRLINSALWYFIDILVGTGQTATLTIFTCCSNLGLVEGRSWRPTRLRSFSLLETNRFEKCFTRIAIQFAINRHNQWSAIWDW